MFKLTKSVTAIALAVASFSSAAQAEYPEKPVGLCLKKTEFADCADHSWHGFGLYYGS